MIEFFGIYFQNQFLFYLVALLVSISSSAFGVSGAVLIPLAALYFGPKEAVAITTLYFLFQNVTKLVIFREYVKWGVASRMTLWALPGVALGAALLVYLPADIFGKILGVGMIAFVAGDALKLRYRGQQVATPRAMPMWGVLYGIFSGALGSGNLVKGPLFLSMGLLKESYVATYAATSLFMNIPKIGIYAFSGIITVTILIQSIPFLVIAIVGSWIGKKVLGYVSNDIFYYAAVIVCLVSALGLILQ
jgi:hypothetical protein